MERWDHLVAWTLDMPLREVNRLATGSKTLDVPAPAAMQGRSLRPLWQGDRPAGFSPSPVLGEVFDNL